MKNLILLITVLNVSFLFMHEFDACFRGEWKMFKFLRKLNEKTQYQIFLYAHLPFSLFCIYYLWTVFSFSNFILWITFNSLMVIHLVIHVIAIKWKSNVFKNLSSFIFIGGAAITGIINLLLFNYY